MSGFSPPDTDSSSFQLTSSSSSYGPTRTASEERRAAPAIRASSESAARTDTTVAVANRPRLDRGRSPASDIASLQQNNLQQNRLQQDVHVHQNNLQQNNLQQEVHQTIQNLQQNLHLQQTLQQNVIAGVDPLIHAQLQAEAITKLTAAEIAYNELHHAATSETEAMRAEAAGFVAATEEQFRALQDQALSSRQALEDQAGAAVAEALRREAAAQEELENLRRAAAEELGQVRARVIELEKEREAREASEAQSRRIAQRPPSSTRTDTPPRTPTKPVDHNLHSKTVTDTSQSSFFGSE